MRILVTGGAGFIGSNFIRLLLRAYPRYEVMNLDKLTYAGNLENLADLESNPNYRFQKGDICVRTDVESAVAGIDAIVHFAAESHVDRSISDARVFIESNVLGTFTLLDVARRKGIERLIHVSTDEVYGSLSSGEIADELFPLAPNSPYAASKAAADLLARSFFHTYAFPVIITRASNNYGAHQFPEKLIPLMITNAMEGKKLPVYGDGLNERDWIYVEDHCRALLRVLHDGRVGEIYNVGYGQPVNNLAVVRLILRNLGRSDEAIEFVTDRPGHDHRYALDSGKLQRELGWKPEVALDEGLARVIDWYRAHPGWVQKAKSGEYREYYEKHYSHRAESLAQL